MSFTLFVFLMFLATYSTRVLPELFIDRIHFSKKAQLFLQLIPYTAMTAMVFPAILSCDSSYVSVGLLGGIAVFLAAWKHLPVIVCVLLAVAVDLILYLFPVLLF